ncbi:amino acid permease [Phaeodactylibacter xiamenensis]|jgi:amino acid transporter|uniref:Amino acid permease n=1 Tax=Phaeodactylibacter xiamenensis TaxID=1524460 RepID=A0A098SA44_9BACT|nr:amino acid permease [Phaeodactylibacter xiamenensis]KGE89394.1 amino acid permease [Phaeodactylibacter xiamenensis]MCR9051464.1 amino acid permease [bacterium]
MSTNARKFGTAPVFFTAISTILGAVMFLRFGFAVGQVGLLGTIAIILIGHAVTIPTAMAIAEIATNQKVEGGGEYYIISRSFGLVIGSSIGIALYFSQGISVAFYIIAFAEAFTPLFEYLRETYHFSPAVEWLLDKKQTVSIPALILLTIVVLSKGADLGVKMLYFVVATLGIALIAFFAGQTEYGKTTPLDPFANVQSYQEVEVNPVQPAIDSATLPFQLDTAVSSAPANPNVPELRAAPAEPPAQEENIPPIVALSFFSVFAIIFPAFTGMTAGVGLSGDLQNPGRSIPLGTLAGTLTGMVVYVFIAYKLAVSASPEQLADTSRLVMGEIAWQGWWLVPVGLAAATISSAIGSILVAPRTLQAIARDQLIPSKFVNFWLSRGRGKNDEPFNATVVTVVVAFVFIMMGGLDAVAEIISMFFMVTYGSLCLISFLQHFAADPSYRPTFRSRWYISLFGAIACFGLMFFMNAGYAIMALLFMVGIYLLVSRFNPDKKNIAIIFQGVIFQISRQLQVFLQKADKEQTGSWRPSAVCISEHSFDRLAAFDMLRWIAQRYGFGTYIHKINGYLSRSTYQEASASKARLIKMAEATDSNIYIDTLTSPSYTSAVAQVIQLPGISGTDNNLLLVEFSKVKPDNLEDIVDNFKLIKSVDFDLVILGSSERGYGLKQGIHIWITSNDYENANLMILLGYIILGHREWSRGQIKIFALYPEDNVEAERERLSTLIEAGQLPISRHNIEVIPRKPDIDPKTIISEKSKDADLTIIGFRDGPVKHQGAELFKGYEEIGNTLFVNAAAQIRIK